MPANPINGMITCSLEGDGFLSYQDTCTVTCDTGYMVNGDAVRTCRSDGTIGGTVATCGRSE